ncbi:RHOMBOID-like protein 2 [Bidens hawaiensis]|uniref:RHOMBOID-like protein 2 n=1 Tax=Bidens hawaiensis TaxID=980011 RepID=UPI0040499260
MAKEGGDYLKLVMMPKGQIVNMFEQSGTKDGNGTENYNNSSSSYSRTQTHWTSWFNNCPKHNRLRIDGKCVARFLGRFSFQPLKYNPLFGASSNTLEKLGALQWRKIVHGHQAWRLVTANWLHVGLIHLVANMLSLVLIGIRLEQQFGFLRVGVIYLLSGFGGSVLSALFIQRNISVGASGALFGLLGTMLSELITNWTIYSNKAAALFTLVIIVVVNLAVGILPFVDNFAHVGGFLTGFLLGFILLPCPRFGWLERHNLPADVRVKSKYKVYQYVLGLLALAHLVAGFTVGLLMLFHGEHGSKHCHWCRYLNCIPTSKWECDKS